MIPPPPPPRRPTTPGARPLPPPSRVEALFAQAAGLPPEERERLLAERALEEEAVVREVRELLAADAGAGDFLKTGEPLSPEMEYELARLKPEEAGERIGPYKLLQELGQGGFGTVWMAEQEQPVRRRVALKIIKLGMDTKEVIARFEQERQALALMEHPNIARVFDAGATPFGRPFFVMELVRGVPITDYCDEAALSTRERLELFTQVCGAIQHAHQKGIIHRDIKPSNVLVTVNDGEAVAKVIDFGVAKATQARLSDLTFFTQFQQMIGTPLYMSPEQAEMTSLDIDTRSDIYSLGVLLYELLTGRTPIDMETLRQAGVDEVRRLIREVDPPKPSTRFKTLGGEELTETARRRKTESVHLTSELRGDLDWIVMRCLEKDRKRRYESAAALAQDVRRHLANEIIAARPPTAAYLLSKLIRRNRLAFAAGAAVLLAVLAGAVVSTWQAVRATRAERLAVAERDRARQYAEEATQQRQVAEHARREAERNFYVAEMNLARVAWEEANLDRLREILAETAAYADRGFEWYHWQRQAHLEIRAFHGTSKSVPALAFSPNGQRMLTASSDPTATLWEVETGRVLLTLDGHRDRIASVAFSPDGQRMLTASADGTAKVWETASGRQLLTLPGHAHQVNQAAFSTDGARIVTASEDETAKVWEAETGRELLTIRAGRSTAAAFSPDGQVVFTAGRDGVAKAWNATTGAPLLAFPGHTEAILSMVVSPDGRFLLTGSADASVKKWDAETGRELLTLRGLRGPVRTVAFSPDGGRMLTSHGETVRTWDAATGRELFTFKSLAECAIFSPDGQRILSGGAGTARLWPADDSREVLRVAKVNSIAFSPDGGRMLTGEPDGTARLRDTKSGAELLTFLGLAGSIDAVAWSQSGGRLLTGSSGGAIRVWDVATRKEIATLPNQASAIRAVDFSSHGQRVATGCEDGTVTTWDASTGRELMAFAKQERSIFSVAFSPDGRRVVTSAQGLPGKVWDAETGRELFRLEGTAPSVFSARYSPDGLWIVTAGDDASATILDAQTGRALRTLRGHKEAISTVTFSPDGRRLLTGSFDKTARIWETETGRELLTLTGHSATVSSVAFSPDGHQVATAGGELMVRTAASAEEVAAWRKAEQP